MIEVRYINRMNATEKMEEPLADIEQYLWPAEFTSEPDRKPEIWRLTSTGLETMDSSSWT